MNEKFEKYIKDLSPELQEKAKDIKTTDELNAFIADNDLELDDELLSAVSGGSQCGGKCTHDDREILDEYESHTEWSYAIYRVRTWKSKKCGCIRTVNVEKNGQEYELGDSVVQELARFRKK